jgi:signal peptidase I
VIDDDGRKRLFVNENTFWSHYVGSWSNISDGQIIINIRTISQTDFDNIDVGENISVKPGSKLIRFQNSPRVYIVFSDNNLKHITESEAADMFVPSWQDRLVIIQNGFENDYIRNDEGFIDSDNDGLSNDAENNIYNTNPNIADTDGDGYNDGAEVLFGYDPNGLGRL